MPSTAHVRAQVEAALQDRIPGALNLRSFPQPATLLTGIREVDTATGGIPISSVTEVWAPPGVSSGKTTLLLSLFAAVTHRQLACALVDAIDCFDPSSAHAAGVNLARLLWVRCGGEGKTTGKIVHEKPALKPLEQAFKAADILLQVGGFGLIVVDLGNLAPQSVQKVPLTTWFRFSRVVERVSTALVFITPVHVAASCIPLVLKPRTGDALWATPTTSIALSHAILLRHLPIEFEVVRGRNFTSERKPVQSANARFAAEPIWA